jgi:hypothetical protein
MNNNDISYTQCYWHANGNLICKKVNIPYNPNKSNSYTEFDSFSCPNSNYQPNAYRQNFDFYQQPAPKSCGTDCSCNPNQLPNQWFSPPRTMKRQNYLDG